MIQWFPGHMTKARRLIVENLKIVDVIIELADARVPASSRNPIFEELLEKKPRVLLLVKADLAETELTRTWIKHYQAKGITSGSLNSLSVGRGEKKALFEMVRKEAVHVLEKRAKRGIINKTVRTMVVGIPNVGKSTFINTLASRGAAETGDKPGVTRGKQWIRLDNDIELLDMPGILWPKIEDPEVGKKLAVTGAINDNIFDRVELVDWLLSWLNMNEPGNITARYKVEENNDSKELLAQICKKRGFIISGGYPDLLKGAIMLLDEFRAGKIGKVTLDREVRLES